MRTKHVWGMLIIIFWAVGAGIHGEGQSRTGWGKRRAFSVERKGEFYQLELDEQVYESAKPGLADLRIADPLGNFVPYLIQGASRVQERSSMAYDTRIIRVVEDKTSIYQEVQILASKKKFQVNRLTFFREGNYSLQVEISGRYMDSDWERIGKDSLYRFEKDSKTSIYFGARDFVFYRIRYPKGYGAPFSRLSAGYEKTFHYLEEWRQEKQLDFERESEHSLVIKNPRGLELIALELEIEGNYRRRFQILGEAVRNQREVLSQGELFRFQHKEIFLLQNKLLLDHVQDRSLKLQWAEGNPALKIKSVKGVYLLKRLVFEAPQAGTYFLYYGNREASSEEYDLQYFRKYLEDGKLATLTLQAEEDTGTRVENQAENKSQVFFHWLLIVLSALLVIFLLFQLKRTRKDR